MFIMDKTVDNIQNTSSVYENKVMQLMCEQSPVMNTIYDVCLKYPDMRANDVLKTAGVSRYVYSNLCRNHIPIGAYRKLKLGRSKTLTDEHKSKLKLILKPEKVN
jgi:hypothetical protein